MPVPLTVEVPFKENSKQVGVNKTLLYNGSRFRGFQKSKGNSYDVDVVIQVGLAQIIKFQRIALDLTTSS